MEELDPLPARSGRAWVFGDSISRRQLLADEHLGLDAAAASGFILLNLHPDFARLVAAGDFLVAGLDFAFDATERAVPAAVRTLGVAAVIARSFGGVFVRQATHVGLPALIVEETGAIKSGDRLRVDIEAHVVANLSSGDRYVIRNVDDDALAILRAGGVAE